MARLGYLFLVAVLGVTVFGPAMAQAGERHGLKRHGSEHIGQPVRQAPIRHWDDRRGNHRPERWRHDNRRHNPPRHWGHRHRHHVPPRYWRHRQQGRPYFYGPPVVNRYGRDHRVSQPYRYSDELGSIDFNINYRLFF